MRDLAIPGRHQAQEKDAPQLLEVSGWVRFGVEQGACRPVISQAAQTDQPARSFRLSSQRASKFLQMRPECLGNPADCQAAQERLRIVGFYGGVGDPERGVQLLHQIASLVVGCGLRTGHWLASNGSVANASPSVLQTTADWRMLRPGEEVDIG